MSYPLDHEACSFNKGTELPDKFPITECPLSFYGLAGLLPPTHCSSTSTDEITARPQKYQAMTVLNSTVVLQSIHMYVSSRNCSSAFCCITVRTNLTSQLSSLQASQHCGQNGHMFRKIQVLRDMTPYLWAGVPDVSKVRRESLTERHGVISKKT